MTVDELVELIEGRIIFGEYGPRYRLVEDDLMSSTQSKRYAVRQALKQLQEKGLVSIERNKGASVRALSPVEIEQIYDMRALLQHAAIDRFPLRIEQDFVDSLRSIHAAYIEALKSENVRRIDEINDRFHQSLFSYCGNQLICNEITRYGNMVSTIRSQAIADKGVRKDLLADHESMIQALESGDLVSLKRLCVEHMARALDAYQQRENES